MSIIQFVKRLVIASILFLLLAVLCMCFMMKHIGSWDEVVLVNAQKRKQVAQIEARKILFVGGSNLAYGIDSHRIEDSLHIQSYNMGLHAGIGLRYMLREARLYLKANDVLVVVPEYNQFTDYYGSAALANMLIQTGRWSEFSLYDGWDTYSSYFCSKVYVPYFLKLLSGGSKKDMYADNPESYDEKGDYIGHLNQPRRIVPRLLFAERPSAEIIKEIVKELHLFENDGVKVLFIPPCYAETCYNMSEVNIDETVTKLQEEGRAFDVSPKRYCLADTLFWNTAYHLSAEGRDVRTDLIIADIRKAL